MPATAPAGSVTEDETVIVQASAVAIEGRALMIEGTPGSGKSSLALALIDRGAMLMGDDGVSLERRGDCIFACPPPNIGGLIEVRGVGIVEYPLSEPAPLALVLALGARTERLPQIVSTRAILGIDIPVLPFEPGTFAPAIRAEMALNVHGLHLG